jgi:hypothetical protein
VFASQPPVGRGIALTLAGWYNNARRQKEALHKPGWRDIVSWRLAVEAVVFDLSSLKRVIFSYLDCED